MPERIVVAMSGGVDSSVAAARLLDDGFEVIGVTLALRPCEAEVAGRSCCGTDGPAMARAVADRLGIRHYRLEVHAEFESEVLRPAWDEYARGRTPDPCIACNERVKFGWLLEQARNVGAAAVATGHYARLEHDPAGRIRLLRGVDGRKDQSYFLYALGPERLATARFPLGEMTKPDVRALARTRGLPTAERPDSQNACLGGPGEPFAEALRRRFDGAARPGEIVDREGRVLDRHAGIHLFTTGQRRGLGSRIGRRAWVCAVEPDTARVVVTWDPEDLLTDALEASDLLWHVPVLPGDAIECTAQVRYRLTPIEATAVAGERGRAELRFRRPVRAATPGQAVVLYDGDRVIGGGRIDRAWRENRPDPSPGTPRTRA